MKYLPTEEDFNLLFQSTIILHFKAELVNNNGIVIGAFEGIIDTGNINIDSTSDIRRSVSLTTLPTENTFINQVGKNIFGLNTDVHIYIGVENLITNDVKWYSQGYYVVNNTSSTYDVETNSLTINCEDWCIKLDGTKNGTIGCLTTTIPAYLVEMNYLWISSYLTADESYTWDEIFEFIKTDYEPTWISFSNENILTLKDAFYELMYNYDENTASTHLNTIKSVYKSEGSSGYIDCDAIKFDDVSYLAIMKHNIIRDSLISVLKQLSGIQESKIMIEDIGEYKAMPINDGWEEYRVENPLWNTVPYDLEFSAGGNKLEIITSIRDLYPNYEFFFDTENIAILQMTPSCENDPIIIPYTVFDKLYISEDVTVNMTEVKNVCEIWGQVFETDFYTEEAVFDEWAYAIKLTVGTYGDQYYNGDTISFLAPETFKVLNDMDFYINDLAGLQFYDESTNELYNGGVEKGVCYTVKIKSVIVNGTSKFRAYLLGTYQAHAISVLSNGKCTEQVTTPSGNVVTKYSKEYFQETYNCPNVNIKIVEDSPFVVEQLGEILFVGNGDDYKNITSNSLCLSRADYELYVHARLTDTITITTVIMPFLDVNIKVTYKKSDSDDVEPYIVKNVSHDFANGTSTITLMRFYELYEN